MRLGALTGQRSLFRGVSRKQNVALAEGKLAWRADIYFNGASVYIGSFERG